MKKIKMIVVNCTWCGCSVERHHRQVKDGKVYFCKNECRSKWNSSDLNPKKKDKRKTCENCGQIFDLRKTKGPNKQRFCSRLCFGSWAKNNVVREPVKLVKRKCINCNKNFEVFPYRGTTAKFCSVECHDNIRRNSKEFPACGEIFTSPNWENRKFCSQICAKSSIIRESSGEREIQDFLKLNCIKYKCQIPIISEGVFYKPDIIVNDKIIEYYGVYWHCHESLFPSPSDYNSSIGMTANEKRKIDNDRIKKLESLGYEVMIVWENSWKDDRVLQEKNILMFLEDNYED